MAVLPYMLLSLPTVSTTLGPAWATQLNTALARVDAHNHTTGLGVPVPSDGLNINADLDFGNNGALNVRCVALTLLQSAPSDLRSVYSYQGDLYYKNNGGVAVQLTTGNIIAGTTGTITGLVSPASAAYNSTTKTLTLLQDTNKYMIVSAGRLVVHSSITQLANLAGISILSPLTTTSGAYNITLPNAPPASTLPVRMASTGALSTGLITLAQCAVQTPATVTVTGTNWSGFVESWQTQTGEVRCIGQITRASGSSTDPFVLPVAPYATGSISFIFVQVWNRTDAVWDAGSVALDGTLTMVNAISSKVYWVNFTYQGSI